VASGNASKNIKYVVAYVEIWYAYAEMCKSLRISTYAIFEMPKYVVKYATYDMRIFTKYTIYAAIK